MIDAFRACPGGVYEDGEVTVRRVPGVPVRWHDGGLEHDFGVGEVDNDLAGLLAGVVPPQLFEQVFTGVVLTSADQPVAAWRGFYAATLARLGGPDPGAGSIGEFAPIYRRARSLVRGSAVLDVASCFGFLPLLLRRSGFSVVASDVNAGSMALLRRVAPDLPTLVCGADALPLPSRSVDTVLLLHLLEHVDPGLGSAAVDEALRVARGRVVVAVPYEEVPDPAYGHVRTVTHDDLATFGAATGLRHEVLDADGGWLVVDMGR